MKKSLIFIGLIISFSAFSGEYDDYAIDPSVAEPKDVCQKYRDKGMPQARPDLNVVGSNYSAQVPVYVVSKDISHGYACGYKVITKKNKIVDIRIEIDAKTGKSQMLKER
ncbi:hypothetical protein [Vibrio tasmaniensis]|uniref:hypothetical protein n=1 Tax=Vibrio tasmaniensis TaxID=212663 RepID=UPI001080394E|nr:hypothetical protein [Vibrio tasmaniensis]